ncbi:ATP-grasp domain-containing protein [Nocardia sp. NPDC052112]|uniref:ATP-grasp domain-containing protein n=1 Tax=Nocardia sp. NPDC052112 TaxID=3155646 RepID=UPI0034340EF3
MIEAKKPAIVIFGLNLSDGLRTFVQAGHDLGVEVVLIHEPFSGDLTSAGGLAELYRRRQAMVDAAVEVASLDVIRALATVQTLAQRYEIRGVYAGGERYVEVTAGVAAVYDLPGPGLRAASISRNKLMQRVLCERGGLPVPAFAVINSAEQGHTFMAGRGPVVAKPCTRWGSAGVRRLDSPADLDRYLADHATEQHGCTLLLEEYLPGIEVSVECLVLDGTAMVTSITHKGKGTEPYFVETLQVVPAELADHQRAAYQELAWRVIELTGMKTGILHLEAIEESQTSRVYPVEWAVREPGHAIMDLVDWRFNGRATPYLVATHLGRTAPQPPVENPDRIAVTAFIELPPGVIVEVRQDRDPEAIPGVVEFDFFAAAGDRITVARDNWSTSGGYSVFADDLADLRRILDDLDEAFAVLIRGEGGGQEWIRVSRQVRAEVLDERSRTVERT